MRKVVILNAILIVTLILCSACQTISDVVVFKKIQLGTPKDDVIELLGSPTRRQRKGSRDWWYYTFYEEGLKFNRMVVFDNGKVIYAGRVATPSANKPAELVDKENAETGAVLDFELDKERANIKPSSPTQEPAPIALPQIIPETKDTTNSRK